MCYTMKNALPGTDLLGRAEVLPGLCQGAMGVVGCATRLQILNDMENIRFAAVLLAAVQVRAHFRPEFLNRIDEFIVFKALQREDIKRIVLLQVERVRQRLAAKKMRLELEESGLEFLAVSLNAQ